MSAYRDIDYELSGLGEKWAKEKNGVDPWIAVGICVGNDAEFPPWVRGYLAECARRVIEARTEGGDVRELLPGIFGFADGLGRGSHLSRSRQEIIDEQFAMAFAACIFDGLSPRDARAAANDKILNPDGDRTGDDEKLAARLKAFFRLEKKAPNNRDGWHAILRDWFAQHGLVLLYYRDIYPNFPHPLTLAMQIAAERTPAGEGFKIDIMGDGSSKISRV